MDVMVVLIYKKAWEQSHCSFPRLRLWHCPFCQKRDNAEAHAGMYIWQHIAEWGQQGLSAMWVCQFIHIQMGVLCCFVVWQNVWELPDSNRQAQSVKWTPFIYRFFAFVLLRNRTSLEELLQSKWKRLRPANFSRRKVERSGRTPILFCCFFILYYSTFAGSVSFGFTVASLDGSTVFTVLRSLRLTVLRFYGDKSWPLGIITVWPNDLKTA